MRIRRGASAPEVMTSFYSVVMSLLSVVMSLPSVMMLLLFYADVITFCNDAITFFDYVITFCDDVITSYALCSSSNPQKEPLACSYTPITPYQKEIQSTVSLSPLSVCLELTGFR